MAGVWGVIFVITLVVGIALFFSGEYGIWFVALIFWIVSIIGRANNCFDAKEQHGNPNDWHDWDADTADDAIETVNYFVDKGMRKEGEDYGGADFVYIFFSGSPQEEL